MTIQFQHSSLASGRWHELTLLEQLGNIGSEVGRVIRAKNMADPQRFNTSFDRMIELMDLTIADPKNKFRLRELCRQREIVCDYFVGDNQYAFTSEWLDEYFLQFALAARASKISSTQETRAV